MTCASGEFKSVSMNQPSCGSSIDTGQAGERGYFFFSSRRRHTRWNCDWSSDVCSSDLVGISMGGMIAQTVAAHHPDRVRTLTSIMSTTGAPRLGRPALSTWRRMLTSRPPRTRAEAMDRAANMFAHIGSHGFPYDEQAVREYAGIA